MSPFASLFKTKKKREKEKWMLINGARLLQEIIAACDGNICYPINIFSTNELKEAMHGVYHHIEEENGSSDYRATYEDRPIFMKRYSDCFFWRTKEVFFNEITTVVQLNHRNVVKVLGCCLEMESPILIFELVPNNLYDLLHQANNPQGPIAWENRLRIAIEIADAVAYLHIAKPRSIIHRDIKSRNILLDEHCRPKLDGFGLSIAIPLGETHVEDRVVGTHGYVDPHYATTGIVTEKVDVYDFGWVMLEILSRKTTRELAFEESSQRIIEVLKRVKGLSLISDAGLLMDTRKIEQVMACVELAGRCIAIEPDQRPTMKEVALKLREIEKHQLPCSSSASSSSL